MIIYGASGHAKVVLDILEACGKKVDFIVDDNPELNELLGYPVRRNTGSYDEAIIAIGSGSIRKKIVETLDVGNYPVAIHPGALVSPRATVGEGTVVMQGAIVQSCVKLGRHCIINTGASVDHDCEISDFVHVAPHATLSGAVKVGAGTWIGVGAVVKQGVTIGANCMIGAGSVVVKDIPDNVTAYGNPCRVKTNTSDMDNKNLKSGGARIIFTLSEDRRWSYAA